MAAIRTKGFTLIELLVVIAIIAVLASILFPVFAKAREKAAQTTCTSNQRQIAAAIMMYVQDHEETLPPASAVWQDLSTDPGFLQCPVAGKSIANAYVYMSSLAGKAMGELTDPSSTPLIADGAHLANMPLGTCANVAYAATDLQTRHMQNHLVAGYLDGHVLVITDTAMNTRWAHDCSKEFKTVTQSGAWSYRTVPIGGLNSASTPMTWDTTNLRWQKVSDTWNLVWNGGWHPGSANDSLVAYTMPAADIGMTNITALITDFDVGGDGVAVTLSQNNTVLQSAMLPADYRATPQTLSASATAVAGDILYARLNYRTNNNNDSTGFALTVSGVWLP